MLLSIYGDVIGILTLLMRTWSLIPGCWRSASLGNCALSAQVMAAARCCCLASALTPSIAWRSASTSPVPSLGFANRPLQSYPDLSRPLRIKDKTSIFLYEMCRCFAPGSSPVALQSVPMHGWKLVLAAEETSGSFAGLTWPRKW